MINCEEVIRQRKGGWTSRGCKLWEVNTGKKTTEERVILVKCLWRPTGCHLSDSSDESCPLPEVGEGTEQAFTKENLRPTFRQVVGGERALFFICCCLIAFSSK